MRNYFKIFRIQREFLGRRSSFLVLYLREINGFILSHYQMKTTNKNLIMTRTFCVLRNSLLLLKQITNSLHYNRGLIVIITTMMIYEQ